MRDHTTTSDGGLDKRVKLLVTPDSQLQVAGSYSLHLEVLASVASEFQDLSGQVLQNGGRVDSGCGTDTAV